MMRLTLFVLCGVEFMNCLLKACAMFFAVDLSLLLNCIVRFGCGVVVFPARWFIVFQYVCVLFVIPFAVQFFLPLVCFVV